MDSFVSFGIWHWPCSDAGTMTRSQLAKARKLFRQHQNKQTQTTTTTKNGTDQASYFCILISFVRYLRKAKNFPWNSVSFFFLLLWMKSKVFRMSYRVQACVGGRRVYSGQVTFPTNWDNIFEFSQTPSWESGSHGSAILYGMRVPGFSALHLVSWHDSQPQFGIPKHRKLGQTRLLLLFFFLILWFLFILMSNASWSLLLLSETRSAFLSKCPLEWLPFVNDICLD